MDLSLTQTLAIWGALLSTLLFGVTAVDFWRRRFRIATTYNFADFTHGNEILVTNLNSQPITLIYWELLWLTRRWPRTSSTRRSISPEDHLPCIVIAPGDTLRLHFKNENYFDWSATALKDDSIYVRLEFAGKYPRLRRIYGKRERRR